MILHYTKRATLLRCAFVLCSSLAVTMAFSQARLVDKVVKKGNELVIPYEKYVLPNGLTFIVHEDHSDPLVHVDVTYHVGSNREELGKSGFAHFFEHMMFQGSDNVADEQHIKAVQEAGGVMNGTTNRDRTNYFETVPANQLEKMLWLEADRMGFLLDAVTQKKFEVQRSTVKNERGQNYENVPYGQRLEYIYKNLYPYGHPYSWLTIGYVEDLNRVNVDDLKNFFLRWYGPNNAALVIAGDVKTADVVRLVEKYFGSIPSGPQVDAIRLPAPVVTSDRYVSYVDNFIKLPMLNIVYPTVPDFHPDRAALACLTQILGQGKNSVLYQQLVKKQLAVQATSFSALSELAGEFHLLAITSGGKSLSEMETLMRAALDSFEARGVKEEDIARFKGGYESQVINGLQSVAGKATQLALFQYLTGNPNQIGNLLETYNAVTAEDVMRVYNKYIKNKGAVVLSVVPKGKEDLITKADNYKIDSSRYEKVNYGYDGLKYVKGKDNFNRSKMPGTGPNPAFKVPKFWRKDLVNGARVIGTLNSEIPTVTMSITIPGGHLLQSSDLSKAGLASFFADMMNEDTKNYTAEQLAVALQKLGSTVNINSSVDGITFNVQALKKNLKPVIALLEERMFNPKFTEQAFNRLKSQRLDAFRQLRAQPSLVADVVFAKLNYGPNHILGVDEDGTEITVKNINLSDIQGYYDNYMTSQDVKVVIVGDISQEEALQHLTFLSKLPNKKIVLPKIEAAPPVDKTKVYLVDIPKSAQSEFRVGYATGLKYDATGEYYKSALSNYLLGGNFNSRLNLNLREDKGWTYGASSAFYGDEHSGSFSFSSGIRANATDSALKEVMREIKDYLVEGPTEAEMSYMRNGLGQADARKYETGFQKATFIGRILDYNLPADYIERQNKILAKITREEMKLMANRYIRPEKLNILLVGDKEKILAGVRKLGYDIVELDADGNRVEKRGF